MGQFDALNFDTKPNSLTESYDADVIQCGSRSYAHVKNTPQGLRKLEIYLEQKELENQLRDELKDDTW